MESIPTLRDYQIFGVDWLFNNYSENRGSILGDEMGLGKTCQTICFLKKVFNKFGRTCLVVCPLSVIDNWKSEFKRFAPSINVISLFGDKELRKLLIDEVTNNKQSFEVLLTTYEIANIEKAFLSTYSWEVLVVDEGHRLKNDEGLLYQVLFNEYKVSCSVLLTGTPVQNNIKELFSLLHFVAPRAFMNKEQFIESYALVEKNSQQSNKLHTLIKPYLLRRTKNDVNLSLPDKTEVILFHGLSELQKKYYKAVLLKDHEMFQTSSGKSSRLSLLNTLMQLRKCCCHPYLFKGVEPEPFEMGDHLIEASKKLCELDRLLHFLIENGHKVLLFSQMTSLLDIIQDYLEYKEYTYERLDGSVRGEERFLAVKNFNKDKETFIFLLSTRAGGQGLNLTAADTIIFMDSDFNPQNDLQAAARAHRIGQERPVKIIRLVCRDSVEEVILKRSVKKLELTDVVIEKGQFNSSQSTNSAPETNEELMEVIKFGLSKLLSNDSEATVTALEKVLGKSVNGCWAKDIVHDDILVGSNVSLSENIYEFEGKTYTKEDQIDPDQVAFEKLLATISSEEDILGTRDRKNALPYQLPISRKKRREYTDEEKQAMLEKREATLAKKKAAELEKRRQREQRDKEKRLALWKKADYTSSSLPEEPTELEDELGVDDDDERSIGYLIGSVVQPQVTDDNDALIIHCVDDSGKWGSGGLFSAISKRSQIPSQIYELAHKMQDLHLGDVHIASVDDKISRSKGHDFVALLVLQTRSRKNQLSTIHWEAFIEALKKLRYYAKSNKCSLHFPRLGHNQRSFNWYGAERSIKKYLVDAGIPTFVYYFPRSIQTVSHSKLVNLFTGMKFYIDSQLTDQSSIKWLQRYVVAYDGELLQSNSSDEDAIRIVKGKAEDSKSVSIKWIQFCIASGGIKKKF